MGFSESSSCRLTCKEKVVSRLAYQEEVVSVIELLLDQRVRKSAGDNKGVNGLQTGSLQ